MPEKPRRRAKATPRGAKRPGRPGLPGDPNDPGLPDIPDIPDLPALTPPVLLLPVRLETKFSRSADELLIRVIPDIVHVDRHRVSLHPTEANLGKSYWRQRVDAHRSEDPVLGLYSDLASQVGTARAAWVAHATQPLNWTLGDTPPTTPQWPKLKVTRSPAPPPTAELMPLRWDARGYVDRQARSRASGVNISSKIPMAPDFATELPDDGGAIDFLHEHGLGWMVDFEEAEALGLGIRLAVPPDYRDTGFDSLLVVGVPRRPNEAKRAQQLEQHLTALRYTSGLRFVRRGSATNHTDGGAAATASEPTIEDYAAEFDVPPPDARTPTAERFRGALGLDAASVVGRIDGADDDQWAVADAMRTATWDALEGKLLGGLLAEALTDDERDTIRDHATAHHRPGGHLPVVQVGDQPYGIHLVSNRSDDWGADPVGNAVAFQTENHADHALKYWDDGVSSVPRMNPLASNTDSPDDEPISTEQYLADVTAVLASEPNPAQLWLRSTESQSGELLVRWGFLAFLLDAGTVDFEAERDEYLARIQTNLREQRYALEQFSADLDRVENTVGATAEEIEAAHAARDLIDDLMLPGVYQREDIIAPADWLSRGYSRFSGKFDSSTNPELLDLEFDEVLAEWNAPIVATVDADAADVATMLDDLADAAENGTTMTTPTTPAPLLWTVLYASVRRVPVERRDEVAAAMRDLARHVEAVPDTALADLELMLLEYLGGASHRIDAWFSSASAARLADSQLRGLGTATPPFIGGWGAVLHLAPGPASRTHGFIPAPTLTHAATAAVLRSGYETLGDEGQTAPLAVDLQSDRVRRAMWLVDGIRAGAPPGDILGARLERRLQEAGRATLIDELRTAEASTLGVAAVSVIDGVAIARSQIEESELIDSELTDLEIVFRDTIDDAAKGPGDAEVRTIIAETSADLDAVADLTVAHSVHQLVQGQIPAARSSLESISTGLTTPPVPTIANSRPAATGVAHTVMLHAPAAASTWPGVATSLRSIADPGAERLAAAVLPAPSTIRVEVVSTDDAPVVVVSLDSLDVSALDAAIDIAPDGAVKGAVRMEALAAAGDTDGASTTRIATSSLAAAALAGRLGAVLRSGRAATELDATPPEVPGVEVVSATPDDSRRADLFDRLNAVVAAGGVATIPDKAATINEIVDSLRDACAAELPFLRTIPTPDWLSTSSLEIEGKLGKYGTHVTGWLGQMAAVRSEVRQFSELIDLADAVHGSPVWAATAANARWTGGWVATGSPGREPNHNVAVVGTAPLGSDLTALVIDGWFDDVATSDASAAAAVHFDAPGAEPPNLWLLALRAEPGSWTTGDLFDCVQNAVLDAQRRMVGPQELPELGQYLPATFLLADAGDDQEDVA